jgi:hypothetical protein
MYEIIFKKYFIFSLLFIFLTVKIKTELNEILN